MQPEACGGGLPSYHAEGLCQERQEVVSRRMPKRLGWAQVEPCDKY